MGNFKTVRSGARTTLVTMIALAAIAVILAACGGTPASAPPGGNPLPTPKPAEAIGSGAKSQAKDSYQATWESFLRDAIAASNQMQDVNIGVLERYQLPSITEKNLTGILKKTDFVEDRTTWSLNSTGTTASALTDFSVRLTFANGDTDTRKCKVQVSIEQNPDDKLWYVVSPAPLAVFGSCAS